MVMMRSKNCNNRDKLIPWDLLLKDFKNDLNAEEKKHLNLWLESSSCRDLYVSLKKLWFTLMRYQECESENDVDYLWNKMQSRINKKKKFSYNIPFVRLVAVAVVLVFVFGLYFMFQSVQERKDLLAYTTYTALTGKSKVMLPDSSIVWLNKGATLSYKLNQKDERRVILNGEALFEVYKNPQKSFVVEAREIEVKVFGTTFSVRNMENEEDIRVALLKGSVAAATDNQTEKIVPGERVIYSVEKDLIVKEKADVAFESLWAKDTLSINKMPLEEVVRYLEKWYDKKILLGESVSKNQAFTFSLTDEPLEEVLRLISRISPIQYQFNDEDIVVINKLNKRKN